jgi:CDGSH-type Zn-finger protein
LLHRVSTERKIALKCSTIREMSVSEIAPEGGLLMAEVTIEARPNGPYIVTGTIELRDTNGNVIATQARTVLCRCGASTKKPFCDGTHSKIGFQAAAEAVPESAEKS